MNQKPKLSYRDVFGYLLIGLSIIMLGKSLMLCFSNDIWYDELFTVGMIEHSYGDLVAFTARDVHPPLYYCIVKFAVELCKLILPQASTVVIAKIVSVLPYFILLLYSVTLIRKRFGIFAGGLFLFCVISMPQLSAYTVEVRMYSWALLFVTAAFLHAYGTVTEDTYGELCKPNDKRLHIVTLVLYGLAAAYTQYFACVAVIMVYLYVLIVFLMKDRRRVKQWILWAVMSIVGYAPWLYTLYRQITTVNENYWILPLTWRSLGGCVKFLMKPAFANDTLNAVLAVVFFLVYVCIFAWNVVKLCHNRRENTDNREGFIIAGVGVLVGLVLFGFVASFLLRPIFVYRYMIPALGCFWLSFAVGLGVLAESETKQPTAVFMIFICTFVLLIGIRDYRAFAGEEEYKVLLMQDTMSALDEIGTEDILLFNFDQVQMVTGYYLDNDSYLWYGQPEILIQDICGEKCVLNEDTAQIKEWISQGKKVWFFGSFNSREDIIEEWSGEGLQIEEAFSTTGCLLERYWFNLYTVSLK